MIPCLLADPLAAPHVAARRRRPGVDLGASFDLLAADLSLLCERWRIVQVVEALLNRPSKRMPAHGRFLPQTTLMLGHSIFGVTMIPLRQSAA